MVIVRRWPSGRVVRGSCGAALLGTLAVGVLTAGGGGSAVAAPGAGLPDAPPAERVLLCEVRPDKIRSLRGPGASATDAESLRDAVWLLEERIQEWRAGAQGVSQAEALVRRATDIAASWREALEAHDTGRRDASRAALTRASGQLTSLEAQVRQSPVPGCGVGA